MEINLTALLIVAFMVLNSGVPLRMTMIFPPGPLPTYYQ